VGSYLLHCAAPAAPPSHPPSDGSDDPRPSHENQPQKSGAEGHRGPVERPDRELIPPRIAYADALATALSAVPSAQLLETVDPLRTEARGLLCRRSGLPGSTDDTVLVAAAHGARIPDPVVVAVLSRPGSGSDVIALGRALAWLQTHTGGSA